MKDVTSPGQTTQHLRQAQIFPNEWKLILKFSTKRSHVWLRHGGPWFRLGEIFIRGSSEISAEWEVREWRQPAASVHAQSWHSATCFCAQYGHCSVRHTWTDCSLFFRKKQSDSDERSEIAAVSASSRCYLMLQSKSVQFYHVNAEK